MARPSTEGRLESRPSEDAPLLELIGPTLASLNGLSAVLLVSAYVAIKREQRERHRNLMLATLGVSVVFLALYVTQIMTIGHKRFGGDDWLRTAFLVLLASHTVLAVCLVPLVLRTFFLAWKQRFAEHRRIARITFPVWMYISVTGVIIYWMVNHLRPYS